jgi:hypothetical protein
MNEVYCGGKGKAICESCKKLVGTTYDYRKTDTPKKKNALRLVAVCDECGTTCAIPHASV